jgi:hypothetical protein
MFVLHPLFGTSIYRLMAGVFHWTSGQVICICFPDVFQQIGCMTPWHVGQRRQVS